MARNDPDQLPGTEEAVRPYTFYALGVLFAAGLLNYIDRQIVSILAQDIKADLMLDDAQLGFLLGTSFAVFYAIVGIAMGRISDVMSRTSLMAGGLAVWSTMTVLAATATSFAGLGAARIGVGVGEATANPCSHSLLSQYFPARHRALALGTYVSSAFFGGAAALAIGGMVVQHWQDICPAVPIGGACGLAGWRAALIIVGLPGLPLALLLASLREPARPQGPKVRLRRLALTEFGATIPPFSILSLYRAGGSKALQHNLALVAGLVAGTLVLILLTGDRAQWGAIALGAYAIVTWGQIQKYRDRPLFQLTFGCPTFTLAMFGGAMIACVIGAVQTWAAPYAMRTLGMSPGEAGLMLGLTFACSAGLGVIVGGWLTDRWKTRDARAPIWMGLVALFAVLPTLMAMLAAREPSQYLLGYGAFCLLTSAWSGAFAALVQDLVLPRMRGAAASAFALVTVVIAAGAGPYWAGKVSTVTGSLGAGLLSMQALTPIALVLLMLAARRLPRETLKSRYARAEAAGEPS